MLEALREGGVDVRLERARCACRAAGPVAVELDDGSTLEADEVLAAFGRVPGTADIGLETIGLDAPAARSRVGDDLRVPGHDWLFAIGDVNGRALLTHMGKYQGRLAADTILGRDVAAALRRRALAARDLHRPAGRGRRPHARRRAAQAGLRVRHVDVETAATPAARSSAAAPPERRGSSSTRTGA